MREREREKESNRAAPEFLRNANSVPRETLDVETDREMLQRKSITRNLPERISSFPLRVARY